MSEWWQKLNQRERMLILLAGTLACILFLYLNIWRPFQMQLAKLEAQSQYQQETIKWMQPIIAKLLASKKSNALEKRIEVDSLVTVIETELKTSQIADNLTQIGAVADNGVKLVFDQVAFDPFIAWLQGLHRQYAFNITVIHVNRLPQSGYVKVDVQLNG